MSANAQKRLQDGLPSATALGAATHRAMHQIVDKPCVFDDPLAVPILGVEGRRALDARRAAGDTPASLALRAVIVARTRYAEDALARAIDAGVRQYLILGAGLDTYAYRHADSRVRVFEIDHPATQAWKRARLAEIGIAPPDWLTFAPIDFASDSVADTLARAGFDAGAPAFCAWLGVTIYLGREDIAATLQWAAGLAPGSEIVFDFGLPRATLSEAAARVAAAGEPWRSFFEPEEMSAQSSALGFIGEIVTPATLNPLYFGASAPGLRLRPRNAHLAHARLGD